jgi:hypothetical protein
MTQIIAPSINFPGAAGQKDEDRFQSVCRYGYDSTFAVMAVYNSPEGSGEDDGINIVLNEAGGERRRVEIFIPAWDDKPIKVTETKVTRTPIVMEE